VGHSDGTREYMRLIDRLFALGFIVKLLVRFQNSPLVTCKILTCLFALSAFATVNRYCLISRRQDEVDLPFARCGLAHCCCR
jgi:hypothetical protein